MPKRLEDKRVAWSCNPWPACIVLVAAFTAKRADDLAFKRAVGTPSEELRRLMSPAIRWPDKDDEASACTVDTVLSIMEY